MTSFNVRTWASFFLLLLVSAVPAEKLYVFCASEAKPNAIQDKIAAANPKLEVIAFGRQNDFVSTIEAAPPDAIIAKTDLVKSLPGYTIVASAHRNGKTEESFVLISVGKPLAISEITTESTIGVFDFLGRKGMQDLVNRILDANPKIKRVTKLEDLLTLLTLNLANAILIAEGDVAYFKRVSNLPLAITPLLKGKTDVLVAAVKVESATEKISKIVRSFDASANVLLGVQGWE